MMQTFRTEGNYRDASRLSIAELRAAAASGEILSFDYDAEHYAPSSGTDTGDYIGEAEAKRIALAEVSGAADSDVRYARLDWDDGRAEYEVKIVLGTTEYEFEIDAVTGVILSRDSDSIYD